ncbi:BsuBI/PstI family type II restriction endonuclease [Cystobacter fuscus]|uniref:BsuBI/PstI family type II restriction endonuclease n=1 Tax=Cystobacter fuscus TaxID=43 RepID=UPI0018E01EF9|nr:BsuBI/PstI family type II restriction endonuclease [Cystobacter fuscus]
MSRKQSQRGSNVSEPIAAEPTRVEQAQSILKDLGMPPAQSNERSALTLLALLELPPDAPWRQAFEPLRGVTELMEFIAKHYRKEYAPNSRETIRRFTLHQFVDSGLVERNPDKPDRAINSPDTVYKVNNAALQLLRTYGTNKWPERLRAYLKKAPTLREIYAKAREMHELPVTLAPGLVVSLSPGGQNELIKLIVEQFCSKFTPGGRVLYLGDAGQKERFFPREELAALGVQVDKHGKMPDVVVHHVQKNWLLLIEAVTSHGPVNPKRHEELRELFKNSRAGLVYVTAFMDRQTMSRFLPEISWETEVWVAEAPTHIIHFNGERFLGPYEDEAASG